MVMPKRNHVKIVGYVSREVGQQIRDEARIQKVTVGAIIEGAMLSRVRLIRKEK